MSPIPWPEFWTSFLQGCIVFGGIGLGFALVVTAVFGMAYALSKAGSK